MSYNKYLIEVECTSSIEWARISLEGSPIQLNPAQGRTKFKSIIRNIKVHGLLDVFCKCKGDTGIVVKYSITNKTNNEKILDKKEVTIGANQPARIGKWSDIINP